MTQVNRPATSKGADKVRLASGVGGRIRAARTRAGMTQQQVAGDRYTKAYISALENGLVRPSVAALEYLAGQLGTSSSALLTDARPTWSRLDADLQLAAGNWQAAADGYENLLSNELSTDRALRAELLRGHAEALVRLDHVAEAATAASQAVEIFDALGRDEDGALASYWLAAAMYEQGNAEDSRAILQAVLAKVRTGLRIEPDFKLRLLMALSSVESRDGDHQAALAYLEQIRGLADDLDDRRRAQYLCDLAYSYTETGDYEAAIRTGYASLALFKAADTTFEIARLENELALAHLYTGNIARAEELANDAARRFSDLRDERQQAHVLDVRAQIEIARGNWRDALATSNEALRMARESDNPFAVADSMLTLARAYAGLAGADKSAANDKKARSAFDAAVDESRRQNRPQVLRRVLTEYADFLAASGDHKAAFELSREANTTSR